MIDQEVLVRALKQLNETGRPALFLDGARFLKNLSKVNQAARDSGKIIRFATKSLRSKDLLKKIDVNAPLFVTGPEEAVRLLESGFRDIWVGYPLGAPQLLGPLFELYKSIPNALLRFTVDSPVHLQWLNEAAVRAQIPSVPIVVEVDAGLVWGPWHIGAKRSPLRSEADVRAFVGSLSFYDRLRWDGFLSYESQDAGLPDASPFHRWRNPIAHFLKQRSRTRLRTFRQALGAIAGAKSNTFLHNGGGSGNFRAALTDPGLTEITVGSGLTQPHLFDGYRERSFEAAVFYALPVSRIPAPGLVTVHRGGWVASGAPCVDRLPQPVYPTGAHFLSDEGAGEIQTPLRFDAPAPSIQVGDWVFFRPAKSGEIFEIFPDISWIEGERLETLRTYRGEGWSFLL